MELHKDFRDLLESLNAQRVDYVVVGAFALAFHGAPRYTGDLDILVRPDEENATKVLAALAEFGFGSAGIDVADLARPERMLQLGNPPYRIDIMTSLTGVSWDEVALGAVADLCGTVPVRFIGREEFLRNKRATNRTKDLADAEAIEGL